MASNEYSTYYHHTDRESAKKILQSGYIKQSDRKQGDAAFGDGTYLTKVGPDSSRGKVAQNNYDGMKNAWESKVHEGKTDVAIKLELPKARVQPCAAGDRDVHLHKGDVKLKDAKNVDIYVRGKDGLQKFSQK